MSIKPIDVAFYWTPREAAAILDYLDRLRDLVWEYYEEDIKELRYREEELEQEEDDEPVPDEQQAFSFDDIHDF